MNCLIAREIHIGIVCYLNFYLTLCFNLLKFIKKIPRVSFKSKKLIIVENVNLWISMAIIHRRSFKNFVWRVAFTTSAQHDESLHYSWKVLIQPTTLKQEKPYKYSWINNLKILYFFIWNLNNSLILIYSLSLN